MKVSFIKSRRTRNDKSWFGLTFDDTVAITQYYYPQFSVAEFLSNMGGSLGLWLGVGVVQIEGYGKIVFEKLVRVSKTLRFSKKDNM